MSLTLAKQMRDFAVDRASQSLLVADSSMLATLVSFTDVSNEPETIVAALEALNALSQVQAHKSTVLSLAGLLSKLAVLCDYDEDASYNAKICSLSKQTLDNLQSLVNVAPAKVETEKTRIPTVSTNRAGAFGTRGGYLHPLSIAVQELSNEQIRNRVEGSLIGVKGVVSVTIDVSSKIATLYCSQKPGEMQNRCLDALAAAGFTASVSTGKDAADKENGSAAAAGPSYITKSAAPKDALVRYVEKTEVKKAAASGGWFGSITSYFW